MKVHSVNVGGLKTIHVGDRELQTGIFKAPVQGAVNVDREGLQGDEQANRKVHGGVDKAVYAYPFEHYAYWREAYPDLDFEIGFFGENLTTTGMSEDEVCIGDELQIGDVRLQVSEPRMPCLKLDHRFGEHKIIKPFTRSGRSGFYLRVLSGGPIQAGEEIRWQRASDSLPVLTIVRLKSQAEDDPQLLQRAAELPALSLPWREGFRQKAKPGRD